VHPLTNCVPLRALDRLGRKHASVARRGLAPEEPRGAHDTNGAGSSESSGAHDADALGRVGDAWKRPPFCTVVTDLNSAHPHW
jgi:hypothetical protein